MHPAARTDNCAQLRRATTQDIRAIVPMMSDFHADDRLPWRPAQAMRALRELIENDTCGVVWLIEVQNRPVGFLVLTLGFSLEFHGRYAFIDEFFIRPEFRGEGTGTAVLECVIQYCANNGIPTVHLEVERSSPRVHSLYERHGFQDRGFYLMSRWIDVK